MKISVEWLSDFVDLGGLSSSEIAERLTIRTAEVDGVETVRRDFRRMVCGRVVRAEPASQAPGLTLVTVDVGGTFRSSVCGAPNVREGMGVVFAAEGATLANGHVVQAGDRRGGASEGVLCAPAEIGLGTAHEALLVVPPGVKPGTPVDAVIPSEDTIIEIDNKSLTHRPDLWGHYGFAREFAAIFGRPLAPYATAALDMYGDLPALDIAVDDADGCPLYSAMRIDVRDNPASPLRIQSRLLTLDSTPVNLLVDVTNYVQLDLGQPTHAFDGGEFRRVRVGRAGATADFVTLDGKTRQLLPDDLLIYGDDAPVALAGVMGGLASGVRPDVRSIVLESANFRAARVRHTSVRLALRTESSLRFEKKLPPLFARIATARILRELDAAGVAPRPTTRYSFVGDFRDQPRRIVVAPGWFAQRAGAAIADDQALDILRGIGFGAERGDDGTLRVDAPSFRSVADISTPEDLSEEVMRLYGYENITPESPAGPLAPAPINAANRSHHRARRVLSQGHGFVEVQTYGWFAGDWLARIRYSPPHPLVVRNPIATTRAVMRTSLVPNLLAVANQNSRIRGQFRIYELGKVFWIDDSGEKREENHLAGLVAVQDAADAAGTFRAVRGALEDVAAVADRPPLTSGQVCGVAGQPWAADGHTVELLMDGAGIGHMGVLPRETLQKVLAGGHAVWFSLRMPPLEGQPFPSLPYLSPPTLPGSWQDFTFEWPVVEGYARLEALLDRFVHPGIESRNLVVVYQPPKSPAARYSFRYVLRWPDRTPSTSDIEAFRNAFLQFVGEHRLALA